MGTGLIFCLSIADWQSREDLAKMSGKGKTIFVTGGAGYVGSHCVHELLKEDYDILAIDNFSNSVKGKNTPLSTFS